MSDMTKERLMTNDHLLNLALRLIETVDVCRGCEWNVLPHEYVQLFTSLEKEAREAVVANKGE